MSEAVMNWLFGKSDPDRPARGAVWVSDAATSNNTHLQKQLRKHLRTSGQGQSVVEMTDAELVARIRAGDQGVCTRLFETYWSPLCAFARHIVADDDEARDVVATVFASLWDRRARWKVDSTVEAYLYGAVRNRALNSESYAKRRRALVTIHLAAEGASPASSEHSQSPDAAIMAREAIVAIHKAIAALPERFRTAIILRWQRQYAYPEIARVMGMTEVTARQVVSRALRMLREGGIET